VIVAVMIVVVSFAAADGAKRQYGED